MFPTKAPRLDGFPTHFFPYHWDICGASVTKAVLGIVRGEESSAHKRHTVGTNPKGIKSDSLVIVLTH